MTPQFILSASLCRIPEVSEQWWNTREASKREIDNIDWFRDSVNADTGTKGIIVADWNRFPREVAGILERYGYEIDWHDTCTRCDECSKHIATEPGFYGATPEYWITDDGEAICFECTDADEYLEYCENNPRRAANLRGINPAEHGYLKLEGDFENGFHPGQNDKPADIYKRLKDKHAHLLFVVDGAGQFDVQFSVWSKQVYEVIVGNIGIVYEGTDAGEAQRTFAEYRTQSLSGYGRAGAEQVTMLLNDEIHAEHIPRRDQEKR